MNLIAHNHKYALFSDDQTTKLIETGTFKLVGLLPVHTKIAYLQYGTGMAALVSQSKVRIYDFLYQRDVYDFESYLKICKVGILKNMLIIISNERILIHDLKAKANKCYIPIEQGDHAFFSDDYYYLKIAYYTEPHLLLCRELWLNRVDKIEGVKYNLAAFSTDCQKIALVLKNVVSIYSQKQLLRLYGFTSNVEQIVPVGPYFFVKLQDGTIIGCGVQKQVNFEESQQILVDFWDHEYDTVLLGGSEQLYEMGKGLVRKYRLDRAIECSLAESKKMNKAIEEGD